MARYKITEKRFYKIKHEYSTPRTITVFPTEKELARKYGVSPYTVIKTIDSPDYEYYKDYATRKMVARVKQEILSRTRSEDEWH